MTERNRWGTLIPSIVSIPQRGLISFPLKNHARVTLRIEEPEFQSPEGDTLT
jgi:hypothetical protein